ncbi:sulfatase-like hydrolase/transferase [Maribellus comscasis]|uniref:Sulfatase-like hydrolase/transferase n=1 Tax=Maribellus comscasis TaxID=2681766 RepID=A0A6I6K6D4_9BACT|nr:sulfatase [Maribellus comscasis]QGY47213.1 sulfatase-like hydrolase/transferase [Maribellus comscasis]
MKKNNLLKLSILLLLFSVGCREKILEKDQFPNVIIFFCDDLGYGDIGPFGHPTIHTPNLDKMAEEGQKWTNFYVAAPVCTPSRAGILTGRLPIRSGMCSENRRVLFPDSEGGLPPSEITIAKALKTKGYSTACIGKWHLGHLPQYSPNAHGFDYYFGIPYSNDMDREEGVKPYESCIDPKVEYFNVPLMRNSEIIERPANQETITKRYTKEAINFIDENKSKPFFLYLAHSMPHVPLFRSEDFANKSLRGVYGDVIEELDWSIGRILDKLEESGLDENTMVVFTSDNGPWLIFNEFGGSAGLLRGGKGGTFEGGMREPTVFWWPGKIEHRIVMDIGSTLDLLPTICSLTGIELDKDRIYDGFDLSPVLFSGEKSERNIIYYYRDTEVYAIRNGSFKAHFKTKDEYGSNETISHNPPLLYDLNVDPSEKYNISDKHPHIIQEMKVLLKEHQSTVVPVENQLEKFENKEEDYQSKSL